MACVSEEGPKWSFRPSRWRADLDTKQPFRHKCSGFTQNSFQNRIRAVNKG